jgi:hypothetical protein
MLSLASCKKEKATQPASSISVKFIDDEDYVSMENTIASWDITHHKASLNALGYKFESCSVNLPNLSDTGYYPHPGFSNIFFTQSIDFVPTGFSGGYIHIASLDASLVKGDFTVTLVDSIQGGLHRTITGAFSIGAQQ